MDNYGKTTETLIGEGSSCSVYRLNAHWVIKTPHKNQSPALEQECRLYQRWHASPDIPAHIKKLLPRAAMAEFQGQNALKLSHLPGTPLTADHYEKFSDQQKKALALKLAQFLAAFHRLGDQKTRTLAIDPSLPRKLSKSTKGKKLLEEAQITVEDFTAWSQKPVPWRLLHKDIYFPNIMVDEANTLTGIIDLGDAGEADILLEFKSLLDKRAQALGFTEHLFQAYSQLCPTTMAGLTMHDVELRTLTLMAPTILKSTEPPTPLLDLTRGHPRG